MTTNWHRLAGPVSAVALVLVATAMSGLVYRGFFATLDYLWPLGLAALVGTGTAAMAAARRWRGWSTLLVATAGGAFVLAYGVFDDTLENGLPTIRTAGAILHGVVGGWHRMLAVAVPADDWDELLVTPALVTWVAVFAAVTLTLRTRSVLAPLAPPLAAFVFALLTVGSQTDGHTTATAVFLTAALALIAVRAHRTTTRDTVGAGRRLSRSLIAAGLTVATSAGFGIATGQVLPLASGHHRVDPRTVYPPPITIADPLTPLARLKPQLTEDPPRTLFTVHLDPEAAAQVDRIRTVALDTFDGTIWTSTDTYRVAGTHLAVDPALTRTRQVSARIELKEVSGPYLPVLGWPTRLTTANQVPGVVGFNTTSGVAVSTALTLSGLRYDTVGQISTRDDKLPLASPSTAPPERNDDPWSSQLRELALRVTAAGERTPYEKLTALERYLRAKPYNLSDPPGHSYAAITRLLNNVSTGYAEQHAAAFALLARALGFPARVAVGYRLRDYRDGTYTVTTADAHAWPEVHFNGYGWVPFEPTDTSNTWANPPPPPPDIPRVVPPPRPTRTQTAPRPADSPAPPSVAAVGKPGFDWHGVLQGTVLTVLTLASLVVLTAGSTTTAKARRRRRRRHAVHPAARVLGAWYELTDRLTERGISPPLSLTAQEVAHTATTSLGVAAYPVTVTAPLATIAVFAPDQLDHRQADEAWRQVERLHLELYPRRISAARLRAAVDPRPLWTRWRAARQQRQALIRLELGRYQ